MTPTPLGQSDNPATCAAAGITGSNITTLTDNNNGSGTHVASDGVASITVTISGTSVSFGLPETLPPGQKILGVVVKGGSNGGNVYNYEPIGGVTSDSNLNAGPTGNGGEIAGVSHILFCYGTPTTPQPTNSPPGSQPPGTTTTTTTTGTSTTTTTTTPKTAVKGAATTKKHKKHKKHRKHTKPKTIRRISPSFTG